MAVYDNGAYCFSCQQYFSLDKLEEVGYPKSILRDTKDILSKPRLYRDTTTATTTSRLAYQSPRDAKHLLGNKQEDEDRTLEYTYQYLGDRGISRSTMEFYGVYTKVDPEGKPAAIAFPYGSLNIVRSLPTKGFKATGTSNELKLFGQDKFQQGSARSITITEGAYDAMALYETLGSKYPVVSVRSASTARGDCERAYRYLNSFESIYLCLDNDNPGVGAAREIAQLFDVNKIYNVELSKWKDANEAYASGEVEALRKCWWNAKKFLPKGIVSGYSEIEAILSKESAQATATYPFPTLNAMAYGIRLGELVLFTALEKVGKTEVLRAIEYQLLKTTDDNVGIIHLEEQEKRSVQGLVGYELSSPVHLPDAGVSVEDQLQAFKSLTKKDGRLHFYTHFGSDDPDTILDVIRYLVGVCHCRYVFLDHITMLVTGFEDEDERKRLDYISTRLAMLTRELNFTLFLVSHVNDAGQTRGSRNIAKVADLIVHLDRDIEASDSLSRNITRLTCRGNRYAGITGPAGVLTFCPKTYTIKEQVAPTEVTNEFRPSH